MDILNIEKRDFVLQANAISQAYFSTSTYAQRLIKMAMSLLPQFDEKNFDPFKCDVAFSPMQYFKSFGIADGKKTRENIERALTETTQTIIKIKTKNKFEVFPWIIFASYTAIPNFKDGEPDWNVDDKNDGDSIITMIVNPELIKAIGKIKGYTPLELLDFGKLQGKYSTRIYEFCLSYEGYSGEQKNPPNTWYTPERSLPDMRMFLGADQKTYNATGKFIQRVIDKSVEEINDADIGIRIEPKINRKGKTTQILGIRFKCKKISRDEPKPVHPATESQEEEEKLIKTNPELFDKFFKEEMSQEIFPDLISPASKELYARGNAIERLKKELDKTKKTKKTTS